MTETLAHGYWLFMLSESKPMSTNKTRFILLTFQQKICVIVLWTKVASALEGIIDDTNCYACGLASVK